MTENYVAQENTPLDRIQLSFSTMSKTHKKIAEYITSNYESASFLTSLALAQKCGVSESSVIRFSAMLGYSGLTEMQRALQAIIRSQLSMQKRLEMLSSNMEKGDSILETILHKNIEGIQRTCLGIDKENFQKAATLLAEAKRVFLFGSRSSYYLTAFMGLELSWVRDNVFTLNVQSPEFDSLSQLREGDVFFTISMPRYLRATIRAAQIASAANVPVIAITDSVTSPLYKYATLPLLVDNEMFSYSDNVVPIVSIITALLNAVGLLRRPDSNECLRKNEENWKHFDLYHRCTFCLMLSRPGFLGSGSFLLLLRRRSGCFPGNGD